MPGDVGTAIVGEPFQSIWDLGATEATLDCRDHQDAHNLTGDAGIGDSRPGDDLPVAGINDKDDTNHLAIAGMDFQMIGAPSDIGAKCNNDAIIACGQAAEPYGFEG